MGHPIVLGGMIGKRQTTAKEKYRGLLRQAQDKFSTAQRTIKLSVASVEMT
jgi:hypothetical protein